MITASPMSSLIETLMMGFLAWLGLVLLQVGTQHNRNTNTHTTLIMSSTVGERHFSRVGAFKHKDLFQLNNTPPIRYTDLWQGNTHCSSVIL